MKLFLTTSVLLFSFLFGTAQEKGPEPEVEVGIVEHLGDTIPLNTWFLDENNDTVSLKDLVDKPTIFSFVYFDCPGICSPLMSGIEEVVDRVDMKLGKDYEVVTISFNTKDTPIKAREKKRNFSSKFKNDDQKNWHFLTGNQENIDAITQAVGFKYMPQGVDFAHPGALIMVSPEGKITRYLLGITFNQFDVKLAIIEAQEGIERPTINRILKYCFSYDPASKGYRVQVTRIVATIMLIIAIPFLIFLIVRNRRTKINKKE